VRLSSQNVNLLRTYKDSQPFGWGSFFTNKNPRLGLGI
jgi:hypothetical protein